MSLVLGFLLLQAATLPSDREIVITSEASAKADVARRFVRQLSTATPNDRPLARFSDPICVGSAGLPKAAGQVVVDRVSQIAASVGLRIGVPDCTPNLFVLFVEDGRAEVRKLARGGSAGIRGQSLADVDRIAGEPGRARAWSEVETRSRDGDRPSHAPNDPAVLQVATSTRLSSPVRRDILSATVLIDRDAVAGRDLRQVADYAAMRALTGARLSGSASESSILALFTPDGDADAPPGLTGFDRSYLEGLYAGRGDLSSSMKRQSIVAHMVQGRAGAAARE